MRIAGRALTLLVLAVLARPAVCGAQTPATGRWTARAGIAFAPWIFDLKIEAGVVTGTVSQGNVDPSGSVSNALTGPFAISEGKAEGNTISFKVTTPDGGRIVTFNGTRNNDQISFVRMVQVVRGDPGRDGILGAAGASQFTATLDAGTSPAAAPVAAGGPAGRWQVTEVPNGPWLFEFTADAASLNGTIRQSGAPNTPVSIAAGKIDGTNIAFKILSPDGGRIISFRGRVNVNEISFVRQIEMLPGGTRGGNDLYGASAALQFVAKRAR